MKNIIVLLFVMLFTMSLTAQDRVNRELKSFEMSSEKITSATGWAYNEDCGEWIDYKNIICPDKSYKGYRHLCSSYIHSNYTSFHSIQVHTITLDKTYYVVTFHKTCGAFTYPNLKMDWYTFKTYIAIVLDEDDFKKLMNPGNEIVEIEGFYAGSTHIKTTMKDVEIDVNNITIPGKINKISIAIYMTKDNQYIRFSKLYRSDKYSTICGHNIAKQYFELPVDEWHKLQNFE